MKQTSPVLICALTVMMAWSFLVQAEGPSTFYVDASYSGTGNGTSQHPFTSIAEAMEQTVDGQGDSVIVRRGAYAGPITVWPGTILVSEEGWAYTSIQGADDSPVDLVRLETGAVLRGFSIGETGGAAVRVLLNAQTELSNCVLYKSNIGLQVNLGGKATCVNNVIYKNQTGVYTESGALLVSLRNNILAENGLAVALFSAGQVASDYNTYSRNGALSLSNFVPGEHDLASYPGFTDPAILNFHLRAHSNARNAGDPLLAFNDVDGTRNDLGADGGPFGLLDSLAPHVFMQATQPPVSASLPVAVYLDARSSSDAWGIESWEWDFDAKDGISYEPASADVAHLFDAPGGYLISLRARDHSGWIGESSFTIQIGDAPGLTSISAAPAIGPAPLTVQLSAVATGMAPLAYVWDLTDDGHVDVQGENTSYTYAAGTEPGLYQAVLSVTDAQQVTTQAPLYVVVTPSPVAASASLVLGQAADLEVDMPSSSLNGLKIHVPSNAHNVAMPIGVGAAEAARVPLLPSGELLRLFDVSPSGMVLAEPISITVPLMEMPSEGNQFQVWFYEPESQAWWTKTIQRVRVTGDESVVVSFETGRLGLLAITRTPADEVKTGAMLCCAVGQGSSPGYPFGDGIVLFGFALALFTLTRNRRGGSLRD